MKIYSNKTTKVNWMMAALKKSCIKNLTLTGKHIANDKRMTEYDIPDTPGTSVSSSSSIIGL